MKKTILFLIVTVFVLATASVVWAEGASTNNLNAKVEYSPTITSRSSNFVYPAGLPILPEGAGARPIPSSEVSIFKPEGLEDIPVNVLESRSRGWNVFSTPYQASIWFKEKKNKKNINILAGVPKNTRLLGQIKITDYGNHAPLEVVKQALYYAKDLTYTSNVVLLQRKVPVSQGNTRGIGGSSVKAGLQDYYSEAITVAGSGLFSQSKGWVDYGVEIIVLCYEDLPKGVATLPFCQSTNSELETVARRLEEAYEPGKKIYFVSYYLQNETKKEALDRAQKTAQKFVERVDNGMIQNFQLITAPYSPKNVKVEQEKIVDLVVANQGLQISGKPYVQIKK